MKRFIIAVTGTRADFGILRPVFKAIAEHKDLELNLLVTGMHLLPAFGNTVEEIRADGWKIAGEISTMTTGDTRLEMASFVGKTVDECAKIFEKTHPDIVLVLGDRGEMLAASIAAAYLCIPVAHIHGGEESGMVDDCVRDAITQLSSVHFTSATLHAETVERMLGSNKNIYVVGAPGLDVIRDLSTVSKAEYFEREKFDETKPLIILLQHSDTTDTLSPAEQIQPTIDVLSSYNGNLLIVGANADAGGVFFNSIFESFAANRPLTSFHVSLPHIEYLSWLSIADILVGNSSSGIIESASFRLPVVNIGNRQKSRLRSGNVIDATYHVDDISDSIKKAQSMNFNGKNLYGDGYASVAIANILSDIKLGSTLPCR